MADSIPTTQNEADFINGLYDDSLNKHKQSLESDYSQNTGTLDQNQQSVQQQTDTYQQRTDVEAEKGKNAGSSNVSAGARQQAALTLGNQKQKDTTTLQTAKDQADAEIERQRQLLASEYEAAIKEAQANNDMVRAQQLYEAAKKEEERLRALRKAAGDALAGQGDWSIVKNLYGLTDEQTQSLQAYYSGSTGTGDFTIPESMQADAEALQKIYDSALEAQNQQLKAQYDQSYSDLKVKQLQQQQQTDQALTDAYVESLKKGKNYNEVQAAYGMGSGTKAQAGLTRQAESQGDLTELRKLQMGYDAQSGQDAYSLLKSYLGDRTTAGAESQLAYSEALKDAYQDRRDQALSDQEAAGKLLAKKENNYSLLGKLWGLTQDQIDRLQKTGKYAQTSTYRAGDDPDDPGTGTGEGVGWADVVGTAMEIAATGGDANAYIQAAVRDGYITRNQAKDLKTNISGLIQ